MIKASRQRDSHTFGFREFHFRRPPNPTPKGLGPGNLEIKPALVAGRDGVSTGRFTPNLEFSGLSCDVSSETPLSSSAVVGLASPFDWTL